MQMLALIGPSRTDCNREVVAVPKVTGQVVETCSTKFLNVFVCLIVYS